MLFDLVGSPAYELVTKYPRQSGILFLVAGVAISIYGFARNEAESLQIGLFILLVGGVLFLFGPRIAAEFNQSQSETEGSYAERLQILTHRLSEASSEVDAILTQMQLEAKEQEAIVSSLEEKLGNLTSRKDQLETTIEQLEQIKNATPLVDELTRNVEQKLEADAKGSRRREITIFILGFIIGLPFSIISDIVANLLTS